MFDKQAFEVLRWWPGQLSTLAPPTPPHAVMPPAPTIHVKSVLAQKLLTLLHNSTRMEIEEFNKLLNKTNFAKIGQRMCEIWSFMQRSKGQKSDI